MQLIKTILVLLSTLLTVCYGQCNFPARWGSGHWMLRKQFPVNNTRELLTYKTDYVLTSLSNVPDVEVSRFTCDEFEISGIIAHYVKKVTHDVDPDRRYCVEDTQTTNVILHKELVHNVSLGAASISNCKTQLDQIVTYDVLLPVAPLTDVGGPTFDIPVAIEYPLAKIAYRVTYTPPSGTEKCSEEINSVLVISDNVISILACDYTDYIFLPLTGLIRGLAHIDPVQLGEADDSNGRILIGDWHSNSLNHNRTYCMRYKTFPNKDLMLSFDLTSGRPDSNLQCMRGQRYDSQGTVGGRLFFTMKLRYDILLVSRQTIPTTQRMTTRPLPGVSTSPNPTTVRVFQPATHVQLTIDMNYDDIEDTVAIGNEVMVGLYEIMGVSRDRLSNSHVLRGLNGKTVVNFDLAHGSPSIIIAVSTLQEKVNTAHSAVKILDEYIAVHANSVYGWRDEDDCKSSKCLNDGVCTVLQGEYTCSCAGSYIGPYCGDIVEEQKKKKDNSIIYIAVGVVVGLILIAVGVAMLVCLVLKKRKKPAEKDDSVTGYADNQMSMEARDREIYSTINKQPKAYHEKSFTTLDKDDAYGERTGIHL